MKNLPAMLENCVWSLCWEDLQEKGMATHSSVLAWEIPWKSLEGWSLWGCKELDTIEWLTHTHTSVHMTHTRTHRHTHTRTYWLSCSMVCGIFSDQGSNLCLLHWQVVSLPLSHQGSPKNPFLNLRSWRFTRASWGGAHLMSLGMLLFLMVTF